jgi:hypothetical protein
MSSSLVKVTTAGPSEVSAELKVIIAPGQAALMMLRKLPEPLSFVLVTIVGPQLTVIIAVAAGLMPAPPELVAPCTWKLKVLDGLVNSSFGVYFNPALPSAVVIKEKSVLLIWVVPSFLNNLPFVMLVILK